MLLALVIAAAASGCGGGGTKAPETGKLVSGPGFTFQAPNGWTITTAPHSAAATRDAITLVSVTVLPLARAYRPALFQRVAGELDRVAATLAAKLHGTVTSSRTVDLAGGSVREYEITHAQIVDRLTFVLRGQREFQLTCRWRKQDGAPAACNQLVLSFGFR